MPSQKRRFQPEYCACHSHKILLSCQQEKAKSLYIQLSAKVLLFSSVVDIFTGPAKQAFTVPKDLLILQSDWFATHFRAEEQTIIIAMEETKICLPRIDSNSFADFICWLYTDEPKSNVGLPRDDDMKFLYDASFLRAPAYSNALMDVLRERHFRLYEGTITRRSDYYVQAWKAHPEGSLVRRFISDLVAYSQPFKVEGSEECKVWEEEVKNNLGFAGEFSRAVGRVQLCGHPCDEENRGSYMEKEFDLEKRWDETILKNATRGEVERSARDGDTRSLVNLHHLNRNVVVID